MLQEQDLVANCLQTFRWVGSSLFIETGQSNESKLVLRPWMSTSPSSSQGGLKLARRPGCCSEASIHKLPYTYGYIVDSRIYHGELI